MLLVIICLILCYRRRKKSLTSGNDSTIHISAPIPDFPLELHADCRPYEMHDQGLQEMEVLSPVSELGPDTRRAEPVLPPMPLELYTNYGPLRNQDESLQEMDVVSPISASGPDITLGGMHVSPVELAAIFYDSG